MATVLLFGDTIRHPAVRQEVPLEIVDPLPFEELGFYELPEDGSSFEDAELETSVRAPRRWGVDSAVVPADLPVAGLGGDEELGAGDVIAIEPGIEGLQGVGGVRFEDLLLIAGDGAETLTRHPYDP